MQAAPHTPQPLGRGQETLAIFLVQLCPSAGPGKPGVMRSPPVFLGHPPPLCIHMILVAIRTLVPWNLPSPRECKLYESRAGLPRRQAQAHSKHSINACEMNEG